MSYEEELEETIGELREELEGVAVDICTVIDGIGESLSQNQCADCLDTAKLLFKMLREYGDENAQTEALERFGYLTGINLDE